MVLINAMVSVIEMAAYIHGVLIFCRCLSDFTIPGYRQASPFILAPITFVFKPVNGGGC